MTFVEDLRKPINIIFLLLAIIGLILSLVFYFNGKKTKIISYQINSPSSLIYDSKNASSSIKVLVNDSVPVKDNVYILTGVIWNSGDMPILTEDVRKQLSLDLLPINKIIDFKITKQVDSEIAEFKLNKKSDNSLNLNWKYFDPGFAFKFQIIYIGKENAQFSLSGKILDIKNFENAGSTIDKEKPNLLTLIYGIFLLFVSVISLGLVNKAFRGTRSLFRKTAYIFSICLIFLSACLLIFVLVRFFQPGLPIPLK